VKNDLLTDLKFWK